LTKKNFFQKVHAYYITFVAPRKLPLLDVLTEMLNERPAKYAVSSSMLTGVGGPMREAASHVLWKSICNVILSSDEVRVLFFAPEYSQRAAPGHFVRGERYYDAPSTGPSWTRMESAVAAE